MQGAPSSRKLCDYIYLGGGTTLVSGVMQETFSLFVANILVPVMTIIRRRCGNLFNNDVEIKNNGL